MKPLVSILIATQDRHKFIPYLMSNIMAQTYPHDRIQLVVGDDGSQSSVHLFPKGTLFTRYPYRVTIGKKRNDLKRLAKGDILVTMDDDDYYFPTYLEHVVDKLTNSENSGLAVLKSSYIFYPSKWLLEISGPWETGWPGASYAYTKEYAKSHHYDIRAASGEEWSFTNQYQVTPVVLEPEKTMIVISHKHNTSNKNTLIQRQQCQKQITDFITNPQMIQFYQQLGQEISRSGPQYVNIVGVSGHRR